MLQPDRTQLNDEQWQAIEPHLPANPNDPGRKATGGNRLFLEAVLFVIRTGLPWRDPPKRFGHWNSLYKRFARWDKRGIWTKVFAILSGRNLDLSESSIDSSTERAHQHAAGARKAEGDQAIGRSRGGPTTKIHAVVDACGRLIHFVLTGGNVNDCTQGSRLLKSVPAENVLGDKGYDTNDIIETIERNGGNAVIPSKSNRKVARAIDTERYKNRNKVERFFCWLKHFRRIATRYEKLSRRFACMILVIGIYQWAQVNANWG
jgi:transposase